MSDMLRAPAELKYRLITRSDMDGLVCAVLLRELDLIDDITFVHPKDVQDGKVAIIDETTGKEVKWDTIRRREGTQRTPGRAYASHCGGPHAQTDSLAGMVFVHRGAGRSAGRGQSCKDRWLCCHVIVSHGHR